MLKRLVILALCSAFPCLPAAAGTFTIEPASSLPAVPSGVVSRSSMEPIPGTEVAPERTGPPPAYAPEYGSRSAARMPGTAPVPEFNPVSVSWCQMNLSPEE